MLLAKLRFLDDAFVDALDECSESGLERIIDTLENDLADDPTKLKNQIERMERKQRSQWNIEAVRIQGELRQTIKQAKLEAARAQLENVKAERAGKTGREAD